MASAKPQPVAAWASGSPAIAKALVELGLAAGESPRVQQVIQLRQKP